MPNQYSHPWTREELEWLKNEYPYVDTEEVRKWGQEHNRSVKAIINQASNLGIKKIKRKKERQFPPHIQKEIEKMGQVPQAKREFFLSKSTKIVVISDNHIPFNDARAERAVFDFLKDEKPNLVVHAGDLLDFYEISNFRRVPFTQTEITEEMEQATEFFAKIRQLLPRVKIIFVEGNHEFRWRKYLIDNAYVFYKLFSLSLPELLKLKKLKIDYVGLKQEANKFSHNFVKINNFYIGHFDKSVIHTGAWLRDNLGSNVITGHTHRMGVYFKTFLGEIRVGAESGCLCQELSYLSRPNWQKGFIYLLLEKEKFQIFPHLIEL